MTVWQILAHKKINLSPLGLYVQNKARYFCTPVGSKVIAHTGVDGNHYVQLKGTVYLVEPMETPGNFIRPVAKSEADFLRLLMACGGEWLIGSAKSLRRKEFEQFRTSELEKDENKATLDALGRALSLTPIDDPFTYLMAMGRDFDPASIRFPKEYHQLVAAPEVPAQEWAVYFREGSSGKPGKEIPLNIRFSWQDREWHLLSAYLCGKGIVLDLAVRANDEQYRTFLEKHRELLEVYGESEEYDMLREMKLEAFQPLIMNADAVLSLNGIPLSSSDGIGTGYYPKSWSAEEQALPKEQALPVEQAVLSEDGEYPDGIDRLPAFVRHYQLDETYGWGLIRRSFLAPRRKTGAFTLTLSPETASLPADPIQIHAAGERFSLKNPFDGKEYQLTIKDFTPDEKIEIPPRNGMIFPTHAASVGFSIQPETDFFLAPMGPGDQPRMEADTPACFGMTTAASIGIIGGADGPTAVFVSRKGEKDARTEELVQNTFSNLTFEPADPEKIHWLPVFHEKLFDDISIEFSIE